MKNTIKIKNLMGRLNIAQTQPIGELGKISPEIGEMGSMKGEDREKGQHVCNQSDRGTKREQGKGNYFLIFVEKLPND